jgi:ferredoxin-NADP reductase
MQHTVKILHSEFITPNVKRFKVERPPGYAFKPGQATDVSINTLEWKDKLRPFTFTNLTTAADLEFIIKIYEDHDGVTKQLGLLHAGDELLLHDVYGAITYQGPGFFIAAGAGITPFIAILRDLHSRDELGACKLLVSDRSAADIILDEELAKMLDKRFFKVYTREHVIGFKQQHIDRDTLVTLVHDFDQHFYVCGPDDFVKDMNTLLIGLGVKSESLVFER